MPDITYKKSLAELMLAIGCVLCLVSIVRTILDFCGALPPCH